MNDAILENNLFPFSFSDIEPVNSPTVADIAKEKLSALKIVSLTFNKNDEKIVGYFTAEKNKESFYDKDTNTLKVTNYIDDKEWEISESDVLQVGYPVNQEGSQTFEKRAEAQKRDYNQVVEQYNIATDLTSEKKAYAAIYGLETEELQDIEKCKLVVMNYINKAVDEEVQKLTKEFAESTNVDPNSSESICEELLVVTEFLNSVKQDKQIFEGQDDYKKILKCWPVILNPSFFSTFTDYVDKYFPATKDV